MMGYWLPGQVICRRINTESVMATSDMAAAAARKAIEASGLSVADLDLTAEFRMVHRSAGSKRMLRAGLSIDNHLQSAEYGVFLDLRQLPWLIGEAFRDSTANAAVAGAGNQGDFAAEAPRRNIAFGGAIGSFGRHGHTAALSAAGDDTSNGTGGPEDIEMLAYNDSAAP